MPETLSYVYIAIGVIYTIRLFFKVGKGELAWMTLSDETGLFAGVIIFIVSIFIWPFAMVVEYLARKELKVQNNINSKASEHSSNSVDLSIIGEKGTAISDFRPLGKFEISGKIYEGKSAKREIKKNDKVVVINANGFEYTVNLQS